MKFELNLRTIGSLLVAFSLILLFILIWVKVNVDTEQSFLCKFVEERPELSMEECPAHDSNTSWLLLAEFGIAFLVLVSGFYMLFMPQKDKQQSKEESSPAEGQHGEQQKEGAGVQKNIQNGIQKSIQKEIDTSSFNDEEKKVYELLQLSQGSMYQSDLIREMGVTKAKMSRMLDRLEGKGVIDRKRRGMTNIVILRH